METRTFMVTEDITASVGQRFLNYIIDLLVQYAVLFLIAIVVGIVAAFFGREDILLAMQEMTTLQSYVIGGLMMLSYYTIMEGSTSRTVGKFVTQTTVVMEDGSKPPFRQVFIRSICRFIPFEHFSCFGSRGWHDSIAKTYVVKKTKFEEARNLFYSFDEIGQREEM